jgi:hypothetical protein
LFVFVAKKIEIITSSYVGSRRISSIFGKRRLVKCRAKNLKMMY